MHCCIWILDSLKQFYQLTTCSAGPPLLISLHPQTENEFLSLHFWGTDKSTGDQVHWVGAGYLNTRVYLSAKNCFMIRALWAGTLSWCRIHYIFFHSYSLFFLTHSWSLVMTSN
jgi:hypothetical protein